MTPVGSIVSIALGVLGGVSLYRGLSTRAHHSDHRARALARTPPPGQTRDDH